MRQLKDLCAQLEEKLKQSADQGTSLEDAERTAAQALYTQIKVSEELTQADLNARMRKSGVKAIRAAIYQDICSKSDKKPTEAQIEHSINLNDVVQLEQKELDSAESMKANLERYFDIFQNAHIYYRSISKGKFE